MKIRKVIPILALMTIFVLPGCQKDSTTIPSGDSRSAFLGNWGGSDTELKFYYNAVITSDTTSATGVQIRNFGGIGNSYPPAKARVSGSTITLNLDQVVGDGLILNGSGVISGTTVINWKYTLFDGATLRKFTSVFTRR